VPLLAAILLQAQAAVFAPPLGVPIRVVTERTQGDGPSRFTVRIERTVRFARDGIGYRADVVLTHADSGDRLDTAAMLQAGFAGLAGRPMTFRLDAAGRIVAIDDRQAMWDRLCAGIVAAVAARHGHGTPAERAAVAEQMAAPLRALPPERQQALLGSLVSALVAADANEPPGTRPIRLPGTSPFGGTVELTGTRSIAADGPLVRVTTRAATDVPQAGGPGARIELENENDSDPRTGLVTSHSDTVRTTVGTGPAARVTERITTVMITLGD
jgi:hypothetical protein